MQSQTVRKIIGLLLILISASLYAGEPESISSSGTSGFYLDYLGKLFFIVIFIIVILFLAYKSKNSLPHFRYTNAECIKIITRVGLGHKSSLVLVKAGNEYLLLGVSMTQVNLIKDITQSGIEFDKPENKVTHFSNIFKRIKDSYSGENE